MRFFRVACSVVLAILLAACGGATFEPRSPTAVIKATAAAAPGPSSSLKTNIGNMVSLDGSASSASSGSITAYEWTLTTVPPGSVAKIQTPASPAASYAPDVIGNYVVTLRVTDSGGLTSTATLSFEVARAIPVPDVVMAVVFTGPSTTAPDESVPVGAVVTLDGSASSDPGGAAVTLNWQLLSRPASSSASLVVDGVRAHLSVDVAGAFRIRVRGTNSAGVWSEVTYTLNASVSAPTVAVASNVKPVAGTSTIQAAVGNIVMLEASASAASGGGASVTTSWSIVERPQGSALVALTPYSSSVVGFVADVAGTYAVLFTARDDASGRSSEYLVTVLAMEGPIVQVQGYTSPVAAPTGPSFVSVAGVPVTLRGSGSYDPSGGSLSYLWTWREIPLGSMAVLTAPDSADVQFTPDLQGSYVVNLAVTSDRGLVAYQMVTVHVGSYPPVVIVDSNRLEVLLGGSVTASAGASYSRSGNALNYRWAIDARPAGSTATIADPTSAVLDFTPDVAGTYFASVTVSDGPISSVGGVDVVAYGLSPGTVPLTYVPLQTKFSKALGAAVIVSANPNVLHLVDPEAATDAVVALPSVVKSFSLSPDGRLAAVLHEGVVSLVDLQARTLIRSSATSGSQTEALVADSGLIYLMGQTGGQWVNPAFTVIDGRTGVVVQTVSAFVSMYGTTKGVLSAVNQKIFFLSEGLSPADIHATALDPGTGAVGTTVDSPYHGDWAMSNPLWLSADEGLLFTGSGTYFRASDLNYAGTLGVRLRSGSHSSSAAEAVILKQPEFWETQAYPSVYKRYLGSLLFPADDVPLPLIGSEQSYGLAIFHRADDRIVMVVQTGSDQASGAGVRYYLVMR